MTTGLTAKIRFVRCPRCHRILPELPDIPVYKCGGCNTILQAKNRINSASNVDLGSQNTVSVQRCELDQPSEDEEPGISSHEAIIPPSAVSNLNPKDDKDQMESGDCSGEDLVHITSSERQENERNDDEPCAYHGEQPGSQNQVCSAIEFSHHDNDELSDRDLAEVEEASISSSHEATIPSSGECVIDPSNEKNQEEFGDRSNEQLVHIKLSERQNSTRSNDESCAFHGEQPGCSNQFYSTIEYDHRENGECSGRDPTEAEEASISSHEVMTIPSSGECILDPNDEKDQKENEDTNSEQLIRRISSEHQKNTSIDDEQSGFLNQAFSVDEFGNDENQEEEEEEEEFLSGVHSEDEITDEILLSAEGSPEGDDSKNIDSNTESSGTVIKVAASSSVITVDTQVGASNSSKTLSPLAERVEEPEQTINYGFEHRSSLDNFESLELNQCSELSGVLKGMAKSPTKSSLAYDGSVSSFDGMEDHFLDHRTRSLKNIHRAANFLAPGESPRREKSQMNNAVARDSQIPYASRSSQINLTEEKHYAMDYRKRNQDDLLQHGRRDFSMQNRNRLRREKYQTKTLLIGRDSPSGYDSCTSGSMFDEFHDSRTNSAANVVDNDHDKVRLLRMVYELQDKLERTCNVNGKASGRVSMGSTEENPWTAMYHMQQQSLQEESWRESEYPRYHVRSRLGTDYPRRNSLSRMASAGKATGGPQMHRSMQLLPSEHWHNRGSPMAHSNHDCYSYYGSCLSSPQHYPSSSQLSARGSRLKPENLRHRNHEMDYLREKNHVVKHHLRPMAGGAPFITCYYCLKLLQIPAEFLLLKRRCNRLKCGHCSKVLEFSRQNRTHIVPYTPIPSVAEPPPSEADERSVINRRTMKISEYYAHDGPIEDPVSSSGDYGIAVYKSSSREGDHSNLLPHPSRQDSKKEFVLKRSQNKFSNSEKRYQSSGSSRQAYKAEKLSSEAEKLSAMSNSPLHQLMGYSSPSLVIRGLPTSGRSMQQKD